MKKLQENLEYLKLKYIANNLEKLVEQAATKQLDRVDFLEQLILAETAEKQQRAINRRINMARIPVLKTIDEYNFAMPKYINAEEVRYLFRLQFIKNKENVIFCGGVGLGKTHLASALAYEACKLNYSTTFITAVQVINKLNEAQEKGGLSKALAKLINVDLLVIDELGYIPMDKRGCDLMFQVISGRYERRSTIITTNRAYSDWPITFNNDATVTSAILDRVLHHSKTIKIEGDSYRIRG